MKTTLLLGSMTGLMLFIGYSTGGPRGLVLMFGISMVMNLGSWFFSDSLVLKSTGVVPLPPGELEWIRQDVEELAARAGIPSPKIYIQPNEMSPNAFATGRSPSKGVVAVTAGLLARLNRREVKGVLAHELGHIANRDTLVSSIAATLAGVITFLAYGMRFFGGGGRGRGGNPLASIAISLLAPLAAMVIRMAISRTREYGADKRAAELTGDPEGLASALEGLSRGVATTPMRGEQARNVHCIVNGFAGSLGKLFSTHPSIEERVRRLRQMA